MTTTNHVAFLPALLTELEAAQKAVESLSVERERLIIAVSEAASRLAELASQHTAELEQSQQTVDRYSAAWEQTRSVDHDEVLPALLAFSTYAATASDGALAAFGAARSVVSQLGAAARISSAEVEARARLLIAEQAVMAAMSHQAAHA